ncbi:MAG: hypothetical protein CBB68_11545 [Rhodospirillaceae bacterium TMED8]|nr:hypothetical protein [Magnetovibrio sp.]OUT49629.1 MAG: hypothetical protein CBB68_11545 [Rhodospirillaceae bacterium TMED8]|tara:strand:+ start:625 stop:882 length:258 start_codon:yes stop_codon:yes gene_type:complete
MSKNSNDASHWLDDKRNVKKIVWALVIVCSGLLIAEGFYDKHPHFAIEYVYGFYAIYGFVMCVGLVLVAKWIRKILMRSEDYYDG